MTADQAFELAHVLAEYTDKVLKENRSAFLRKLEIIDDETRTLESSTSNECSAPSSNKDANEPNPSDHTVPLQTQVAASPDPGHRSTFVIDAPIPREDGIVDKLWDFVREHGFEAVRQDEVGHLLELFKYYLRIMTKGDGPTPYRVKMPK